MTVLVSDSFNRANSTATLGSTDSYNGGTVKVWNVLTGPIGINNNQAYVISTTTQNALAVIDAGQSDVTISINIQSDTSVLGGIYARVVNSNSWIRLVKVSPGSLYLQTFDGTTTTTLATKTGLTFASGDLLKLTLQGNTLTAYFNGTSVITATSSFNQTATQHGFGIQYKGSSTYFDNFQIEDLNTGGTGTTVTSVIADSTADALAPTISTQSSVDVSITSVIGTSIADALNPVISTDNTITSIVADAAADGLAPQVGSFTNVTVNSIVANSTADMLNPGITTTQNISVVSPVSDAVADALVPSIAVPMSTQITAVFASAIADALYPVILLNQSIWKSENKPITTWNIPSLDKPTFAMLKQAKFKNYKVTFGGKRVTIWT